MIQISHYVQTKKRPPGGDLFDPKESDFDETGFRGKQILPRTPSKIQLFSALFRRCWSVNQNLICIPRVDNRPTTRLPRPRYSYWELHLLVSKRGPYYQVIIILGKGWSFTWREQMRIIIDLDKAIKLGVAEVVDEPDSSVEFALTVEEKPKENLKAKARNILVFLNNKANKNFRDVDANITIIVARIKEGYSDKEFRQVIVKKSREWYTDEKMACYLRPKTLFNKTNFANYVGELVAPKDGTRG